MLTVFLDVLLGVFKNCEELILVAIGIPFQDSSLILPSNSLAYWSWLSGLSCIALLCGREFMRSELAF